MFTFKPDFSSWNRIMPEYYRTSKYSLADIINKKAYYVTRRSLFETPLTPIDKIESELGKIRKSKKNIFSGKLKRGSKVDAPLIVLIVQSLRKRAGKKGLSGTKMAHAIAYLMGARRRSRAFLKAGWLPAVKILAPFKNVAGKGSGALPAIGNIPKTGKDWGTAKAATPGWNVMAVIENAADLAKQKSKWHMPTHRPDALVRVGGPALQRAIDNEAASMAEVVWDRFYQDARKLGIIAHKT